MVLYVESDAVYITVPEAISCYSSHFYLRYWPSPSPIKPNPERKVPIHTDCITIRNIVSSSAEYETCRNSNNRISAIVMQPALISLDHKQPSTPLKTDNYTTELFVNFGMNPSI